ncbi:hypothetical protein Sps_02985 [Shewanella psychrophila]|uniref:Uncharacterized protein n=1 Tax=Shewanella psychrophila TaxID=225848 RepID=A0A1S6HRK1_9GAMM|nr:hypothetical protein [Shewanella psychrophila]AQS38132.1 hypothetical protein Sps_02985 [Shewanella psychrophila]
MSQRNANAAFQVLSVSTLISMFPIPTPVYKNAERAKQEQRKRKEAAGDPLDEVVDDKFNNVVRVKSKD